MDATVVSKGTRCGKNHFEGIILVETAARGEGVGIAGYCMGRIRTVSPDNLSSFRNSDGGRLEGILIIILNDFDLNNLRRRRCRGGWLSCGSSALSCCCRRC